MGLGMQVPSIVENSKGEEDFGDDVEMIGERINESKAEVESQGNEGSDVEPPLHEETSQQDSPRSNRSAGSRQDQDESNQ